MKKHFFREGGFWIRVIYLLPLILGILFLVFAFVPHLYFVYDGAVHETMSPISLVNNTWETCQALLEGDSEDPYAIIFSYVMTFFVILYWIFVALYAFFVALLTVCSIRAFSVPPTHRVANKSKRWLHLLCPNRVCYVLFGLLPIFPSFFPYILSHFYYTRLGLKMKVFFFGLPDPVWVIGLVLAAECAFLLTLNLQARTHLDLFRLYKKKPAEHQKEDESCLTEN